MNEADTRDPLLTAAIHEQLQAILEVVHVKEIQLTFSLAELQSYNTNLLQPLRVVSRKDHFSQIVLSFAHKPIGTLLITSSANLSDVGTIQAAANTIARFLENYLTTLQQKRNRTDLLRYMLINLQIKDPLTYIHVQQVYSYSLLLANRIHLNKTNTDALGVSALLHDVGKLAIPNTILKKPLALTKDEFEIMKSHPVQGFEYLLTYPEFVNDAYIAFYHHERWDGQGYPYGLVGDTIPLEARILAIADTFDAMTGARLYRKALSVTDALAEIKRQAGKQFDPYLAHQFTACVIDSLHDRSVKAWNNE